MQSTLIRPRATEGILRRWRALGILLTVLVAGALAGAPLEGQEPASPATALFEGSLVTTVVKGDLTGMGGGAILVGLTRRLKVGGAGAFMFGQRRLAGTVPGSDLDLRMAYGGLVAQWQLAEQGDRALWVRTLAGVGNGSMDLALVGTEIAADNFGVFAPEMGGRLLVNGPFQAGLSVGYRAVFAVEDLPGVTASDLRGPYLTAHLTYRLF